MSIVKSGARKIPRYSYQLPGWFQIRSNIMKRYLHKNFKNYLQECLKN